MMKFPALYLIGVLCTILANPAQALQRSYVASYGNDANSCEPVTPCLSFAKAITVVGPNGEVVALDSFDFGPVTLTQSISLTAAPGAYAAISVLPGATGVTIATPGVHVVLRGLIIKSQGGDAGILMSAGAKLSIENCVISDFSISSSPFNQYGVLVETAASVRMVNTLIRDNDIGIQLEAGATADISGSKFFGNSTYGIVAYNFIPNTTTTAAVSDTVIAEGGIGIYAIADTSATAAARVEMIRSVVSNANLGVVAESAVGTASVSIRKSMVTGAQKGLSHLFNGTLISYGNNTLSNNAVDVAVTLTPASPL